MNERTPETREPAGLTLAVLSLLQGIPADDWTEGTHTELAFALYRLNVLRTFCDKVAAEISQTLIDGMETDDEVIPSLGVLHRTEGSSSTWKHKHSAQQMRDDLVHAVETNVATDIQTGDINPHIRNVARAAVRLALEAIPSFSSLNKAGRERLGLDIGDYRDFSTPYKLSIEAIED